MILAALRPEQFDRYLDRVELKPLTSKPIVDRQRLVHEIEDVRTSGIGFDDGEFDEEVRCAAMPVRDFSGQLIGVVGISGPHGATDDPNDIVLYESCKSETASQAHRQTEHFKTYVLGRAVPLLAAREVRAYAVDHDV